MTRGKSSRLRMGRFEDKHRMTVIKGRALVGDKIYRIVQVIDHTAKTSRLVVEAPKKIADLITVGLYDYIR